jgi:hypothetical protein
MVDGFRYARPGAHSGSRRSSAGSHGRRIHGSGRVPFSQRLARRPRPPEPQGLRGDRFQSHPLRGRRRGSPQELWSSDDDHHLPRTTLLLHPAGASVTINIWPTGWVCQAVRARGSNDTEAPDTRDGAAGWISVSILAAPVKYSAGPGVACRVALWLMVMVCPCTARASEPSPPQMPCR